LPTPKHHRSTFAREIQNRESTIGTARGCGYGALVRFWLNDRRDLRGEQVSDLPAFNAGDLSEVNSRGRSLDHAGKIYLTIGENRRRRPWRFRPRSLEHLTPARNRGFGGTRFRGAELSSWIEHVRMQISSRLIFES